MLTFCFFYRKYIVSYVLWLWSFLWFYCVLASDCHWTLCFLSSVLMITCFTVLFHRWGKGPLCGLSLKLWFYAVSKLRLRFHCDVSKTGLSRPVVFLLIVSRRLLCCNSSVCFGGFIYGVWLVIICSSSLLVLEPREGCFSWLWHFISVFMHLHSFKVLLFYINYIVDFDFKDNIIIWILGWEGLLHLFVH